MNSAKLFLSQDNYNGSFLGGIVHNIVKEHKNKLLHKNICYNNVQFREQGPCNQGKEHQHILIMIYGTRAVFIRKIGESQGCHSEKKRRKLHIKQKLKVI